jgi:hypothetical protein
LPIVGHKHVIGRAVARRIKEEAAYGIVSTLHQRPAREPAIATRAVVEQDFVCLPIVGHKHVIGRAVARRIDEEPA